MQKIDKTETLRKILSGRRFTVDYFQREYRWGGRSRLSRCWEIFREPLRNIMMRPMTCQRLRLMDFITWVASFVPAELSIRFKMDSSGSRPLRFC